MVIASTSQPVTFIPDPNGETEDTLETIERGRQYRVIVTRLSCDVCV